MHEFYVNPAQGSMPCGFYSVGAFASSPSWFYVYMLEMTVSVTQVAVATMEVADGDKPPVGWCWLN